MKNKNELKDRMKRLARKGFNFGLCALLAGGITMGAVQGVSAVTGLTAPTTVSAAEEKATLLTADEKTEKAVVKGTLDVSDIVEKAMPSVVSITTKSIEEVESYYGYYFGYNGYAPQEQEVEGSGSGIILAKNETELLVATNYHVVEGATTLSVTFVDNNSYEAKVKGYDIDKDLAIVSVPLSELSDETTDSISAAVIGSSDDLRVGEQVLAIGNSMGYGQSVTTGIVSAKNRRIDADASAYSTKNDDGVNLIQTDAAINPGNSGGALLNMNGEVVGINSAKLASTAVEGMGYAIAISDVSDVLVDLMNTTTRDKVEGKHGVLGIVGQSVGEEVAGMYGVPEGVFVLEITPGGAAEAAGVKPKSIITKFDGKRVHTINELVELMEYYEPGEEAEVTIQVMDADGYQEQVFTITLGESADEPEDDEENNEENNEENDKVEDVLPGDENEDTDKILEPVPSEEGDFFGSFEERIPDFREFFR